MNEDLSRRRFLQVTAGAAAGIAAGVPAFARDARNVAIVVDPNDAIAATASARWAADELRRAVADRGVPAVIVERAAQAPAGARVVVAAGLTGGGPESLALFDGGARGGGA